MGTYRPYGKKFQLFGTEDYVFYLNDISSGGLSGSFYWADQLVSATSNAQTEPTFKKVTIGNSISGIELTDSLGNQFGGLWHNGSALWIGAKSTSLGVTPGGLFLHAGLDNSNVVNNVAYLFIRDTQAPSGASRPLVHGQGGSSTTPVYVAATGEVITISGKITNDTFGNADTATQFADETSVALTGDVTGTATSYRGWSIATTIANGVITNAKIANPYIELANINIPLGSAITANELKTALGLTNAVHYIGKAVNTVTDGGTQDPGITGYDIDDAQLGDIILDRLGEREYIWGPDGWELLGPVDSTEAAVSYGTQNRMAYYSANNTISSAANHIYGNYTYTLSASDTSDVYFSVSNSNGSVRLLASTYRGLHDPANGRWIIAIDGNATHTYVPLWANTGSLTQPIYFNGDGEPRPTSYALEATVNDATQNGVAYYSTSTEITSTDAGSNGALLEGKGASLAPAWHRSENGAVYATAQDGSLQWGTLPTAQGGTGNTSYTSDTLIYAESSTQLSSYTSTRGGSKTLWYLDDGVPTDSDETVGDGEQPVYLDNGVITETTYHLKAHIEDGTQYRAAYYSDSRIIEDAGSIYMDDSHIGVNGTNTSYQFYVNGISRFDNTIHIYPALNNYREGIRIYPYGSWTTIVLGGNDLIAENGTSANSWSIHNQNSNFYITRNGSSSSGTNETRSELSSVDNQWRLRSYVQAHKAGIYRSGLHIYGPTYGNTAADMVSGTADGDIRWGDGGPQITFDTNATPGNGQVGALIFTDNDYAGAGASFHFVTNQSSDSTGGSLTVSAPRFRARKCLTIGLNSDTTSYNLSVNGTSYFNNQMYINYNNDVALNTTSGSLIIGNKAGENLAFDGNEIMARNNGAKSALYLNDLGGAVYINNKDNTYIRGPLLVGYSDAAADTGYATANSGSKNYIAFYGVNNDGPGSYNHTYIGESIYGPKTESNEKSELLLFKGNDVSATAGPDRIRLFAKEIEIQNYATALSGTWDTIRATSGTRIANFTNNQVTVDGKIFITQSANNRDRGIIGTYDYTHAAAIWSMGVNYQIAADGSGLGTLYGAAYGYGGQSYMGNNGYAGGHQFLWCANGTINVALGTNLWNRNTIMVSSNANAQTTIGTNNVGSFIYNNGVMKLNSAAAAWTYLRLHNGSNVWDIATKSDDNSGALQFRPGGTEKVLITTEGEIITPNTNAFRASYGNYGVIQRNDGSNYYFLLTASGSAKTGSWNSLRPLYFNLANGRITMANKATISTNLGVNGTNDSYNLYVNGTSYFNGNTTHNGIDYFANGTTYYINNSGTGNLNALTVNNTTASTSTGTGGLIVKGGAGIAGRVTASEFNATRSMIINAGKVYSNISGSNVILPAKTTMLFANGIAIANPGLASAADVGWLRVTGTAETDTVLELATGDDGGSGETIHVRQYNTSNEIVNDLTLLDTLGNTQLGHGFKIYYTTIPARAHINAAGWWKIAHVTDYFNFDIYIDGGWNTGSPTIAIVNIAQRNGTAIITQKSGLVGDIGSQIKLGKTATDAWDVLIYIPQFATDKNLSQQHYTFVGRTRVGSLTLYQPSTRDTTAYSAETILALKTVSGVTATSLNVSWASWTNGTTAGPQANLNVAGTNIRSDAIPAASASISGIVTTAAQTFAGIKTFTNPETINTTTNGAAVNFKFSDAPSANTIYGQMWIAMGNNGGRFYWREWGGTSSGRTAGYEQYCLPACDAGQTNKPTYDILTTKNQAAPAKGTANYLAYYSAAGTISSSSIGTNGTNITMPTASLITAGNNATHRGLKIGDTYINAIGGNLIFQNNTAIRFGTDTWDYNQWAGLKYVHSSKAIYLGLADGTAFTANSAQSGGVLYLPGIRYLSINGKTAIDANDSWLRINEGKAFSSGVYFGSNIVRTDGQLQVGSGGANFYANSSGNGYFSNTLGIAGTNTGYKLYVNGTSYLTNNLYINAVGSNYGIYAVGTKATYRMIRFIDNTGDTYGNGIVIGGGGLTILGSGESGDTLYSNLGYTGGSEITVIGSDGEIAFYPGNNSYDASAKLSMTASRFWAGVNGNTTREAQVGVQSGAGQLYLWSAASATGVRGLWSPAHGSGVAQYVVQVDNNNIITHHGGLTMHRTISGTSHAVGLQTEFNNNKATIPRSQLISYYSSAMSNGSVAMGYFLSGYDSTPYGGFFVAHYNTPRYVGISSGTYTQWRLLKGADSGAIGGTSTPIYIDSDGIAQPCTAYGSAGVSSATNATNATNVNMANGNGTVKYFVGVNSASTGNQRLYYNSSIKTTTGNVLLGAAWNDYAEFRQSKENKEIKPGQVVYENGDDTLSISTQRLMRGCNIVSDTYGFAIGESEKAQLPIAVSGRVLAYPYESREEFKNHIGWPVCSGPNGTVSIMTEEEEMKYPSRIIGTISAAPDYEIWHGGTDIVVDGRVWIKVK